MRLLFRRARKSKLERAVDRARRRLLRREATTVKRLRSAYLAAIGRVKADLDLATKRLNQMGPAQASRAAVWERARLQSLLSQLRLALDEFGIEAGNVVDEARKSSLAAGHADAQEQLGLALKGSFQRASIEAVERVVEATAAGSPLKTLFMDWGRDAAVRVERRLIEAVASGDNPRKLARTLRREVGQERLALSRALNIARTETLRAYRGAAIVNYQANSDVVVGWRWLATMSLRTCAACLAMHGRVFPLERPFPAHPSCRCAAIPVTRNVEIGIPDAERWLKSLSRRDQNRVLGTTRARLWRDGRLGLADMAETHTSPDWGDMVREASLRSLIRRGVISPQDLL